MLNSLQAFLDEAAKTDKLEGRPDHEHLLLLGLIGEMGSIVTELKKEKREGQAYPSYRNQLKEEIGDFLWYLARITSKSGADPSMIVFDSGQQQAKPITDLPLAFDLAEAVHELKSPLHLNSQEQINSLWNIIEAISQFTGIFINEAASQVIIKNLSRWPIKREYCDLFDKDLPEEDQLPRFLRVEFRPVLNGDKEMVLLRANGINIGDRLTDNISDQDWYRYHDVFHFAYAAHLGWSPVTRSLLRCKRKSQPRIDRDEDGARAAIIEEAIAATVFARLKQQTGPFQSVDYDLLKFIKELVQGYEVEAAPLWQWEEAIVAGFSIFQKLKDKGSGFVTLDLQSRTLHYEKYIASPFSPEHPLS